MFDARLLYRIYSCIHFHWHCWTIVGNSRCMVYSEPMHDKWTVANQVAFSLTLQLFILWLICRTVADMRSTPNKYVLPEGLKKYA